MIIFNGQDYKSTMYTGVADTEKDEDKIIAEMQKATRSDARDDEIRRLEVIAYSETMVNKKAEVLKGLANGRVAKTGSEINTNAQYEELINRIIAGDFTDDSDFLKALEEMGIAKNGKIESLGMRTAVSQIKNLGLEKAQTVALFKDVLGTYSTK